MSDIKQELIQYRLGRSKESLDMANAAIAKRYWNSAASDLYYTCFYLVIALFAKNDIKTSTHPGVRTELGLKFIKEGVLDAKWGKLLSELFDLRQRGDYSDFAQIKEEKIVLLRNDVIEFDGIIKKMLQD